MIAWVNHYEDKEGRPRVSPPHSSRGCADACAERVERATGGGILRVEVKRVEVEGAERVIFDRRYL